MSEPFVLSILVLAGAAAAHGLGIRSASGLVALSLPVGAFTYVLLGAALVVTGLPAYPIIALVAVLVVGAVAIARGPRTPGIRLLGLLAALGVSTYVLSAALVTLAPVTMTADSFNYLAGAGVLADHGGFADGRSWWVLKRGLTVPYLHALGHLAGRDLMLSMAPLLALSGVLLLSWIASQAWWGDDRRVPLFGLGVLSVTVAAIATMPRTLFHAAYVHTHLVFAVAALLLVGMGWLTVATGRHRRAAVVTCVLGAGALVMVRPDGPFFALIALAPLVTSPALEPHLRAAVLGAYGLITAAWNAFVASYAISLEGVWRLEPWALVGLGALCILAAIVVWRAPRLRPPQGLAVHGGLVALWVLLGGFALRQGDLLAETLRASWANITAEGLWGRSLLFLAVLAALAAARSTRTADRLLWFPVAAFVPFWLLLPHLRGTPWRIAPADSGNRMIFHIVLLVGLWVAVTIPRRRVSDPAPAAT